VEGAPLVRAPRPPEPFVVAVVMLLVIALVILFGHREEARPRRRSSSSSGYSVARAAAVAPPVVVLRLPSTTTSSSSTTSTSTTSTSTTRPPAPGRDLGIFEATCYALRGRTASGAPAGPGSIAVDPRVIPLGSVLEVEGYGRGRAVDTGSAIVGRRLDVWLSSSAECARWGRRSVAVRFVG
jgi:3D (Asp-Asp-Asp) domain-containing protein